MSIARSALLSLVLAALAPRSGVAQVGQPGSIRVTPATVRVNSQEATTVFLSYTGMSGYTPADAAWCGSLVVAEPDIGFRCDPATVARRSASIASASPGAAAEFTEAMSVSAPIARQAYAAAASGQGSGVFYYVRRFVSTSADPRLRRDQYVVVTCRLTSGGVGAPFALTNVTFRTDPAHPILFVRGGETAPPISAEIAYNGSGRLRGRWEVVFPGEEWPTAHDLLSEASLPLAERGAQKRYTVIDRFDQFLAPTGRTVLRGPDPSRIPTTVDGPYLLLLRIEATDDGESRGVAGPTGLSPALRTGGGASFPMPTLRYVVGGSGGTDRSRRVVALWPRDGALVSRDSALTLMWGAARSAANYRVELESLADATLTFSAVAAQGVKAYQVPSFLRASARDGRWRWRVLALDALGRELGRSDWRTVHWPPQ
ncbi:MAG: hypothetical protein JWO05_2382 [Gemmatimonadetes bacterium]|nr:hypothetical protein [Gemmatimonadota bacterium]